MERFTDKEIRGLISVMERCGSFSPESTWWRCPDTVSFLARAEACGLVRIIEANRVEWTELGMTEAFYVSPDDEGDVRDVCAQMALLKETFSGMDQFIFSETLSILTGGSDTAEAVIRSGRRWSRGNYSAPPLSIGALATGLKRLSGEYSARSYDDEWRAVADKVKEAVITEMPSMLEHWEERSD